MPRYDETPLTVGLLRKLLEGQPDDMPVWGGYDGNYAGGPLSVGDVTITSTHEPVYRRKTDRPVLLIES